MRFQADGNWLYWIFTAYLIVKKDRLGIGWETFIWWVIFGLSLLVGKDLWERYHNG